MGIYGAVRAQEAAVDLVDASRDGDDLFFWGYTLDRNDVCQALIDAHMRRRVVVKVLLDKKMCCESTTKGMFEQVARLSSHGVQVRLATGGDLQKEYNAVGRTVKSGIEGVSHSKAILSGLWLLCGSTNWTTSSRGNVEMTTLSHLNEHASREQYRIAQAQWEQAEEFTEDLRRQQEHNSRGASTDRSRSASVSRPEYRSY
jgi:phosphatidylserine/phosphatidylglycerophosphate/cardiolipin synthase-like enzyme